MKAYADTNFFTRLYLPSLDLPRVNRKLTDYLQRETEPLPFTPLHRLEFRNAIRLMVFRRKHRGEIALSQAQARQILFENETDVIQQVFIMHRAIDWTDALREAERISVAHTEVEGFRSLDLIHVGSALALGKGAFWSFDRDARRMAAVAGLAVWPESI